MQFAVVAARCYHVPGARRSAEAGRRAVRDVADRQAISGHLAVQVKINGKGPYRLVFDTGAPMILVSTESARKRV